jgi:hypothetical protein
MNTEANITPETPANSEPPTGQADEERRSKEGLEVEEGHDEVEEGEAGEARRQASARRPAGRKCCGASTQNSAQPRPRLHPVISCSRPDCQTMAAFDTSRLRNSDAIR